MAEERSYSIEIRNSKLVFRTTSFKAEEGSFLHSGIFNRELTSSMASGITVILALVVMYMTGFELSYLYLVAAFVLFTVFFILFRMFIFYESYLEAVMDKAANKATVLIKGLVSKKVSFSLSEISHIGSGITIVAPENPDGVKFVEKIALQHGTVIPGFGEVKEFHTVHMELNDGRDVMLFSSRDKSEANAVIDHLKRFIGDKVAKKD